jgi:selenocysteine lyase/cysteine desulfurase
LLDSLTAYKVRPASDEPPDKWETGTQSYESLAGVHAAVEYLDDLGRRYGIPSVKESANSSSRPQRLKSALGAIKRYEEDLSLRFLQKATTVPGLRVYGITDIERLAERAPTFAVSLDGYSASEVAERLGQLGLFVYDGHYYAVAVMERLGLLESGGLVRIGFVHYNTADEVDRTVQALKELASD